MFTSIHPKLPMRDKAASRAYYVDLLGFEELGMSDFKEYLMVKKDNIEIHFFLFKELDPKENYGQIYIRTNNISGLYQWYIDNKVPIHPNGMLQAKPWGQVEFSVLDPDNNLITFGQGVN